MAGIKELSIGRSDLYKVNPKDIKIKDEFNVRINYGDIEGLKESIINSGLKIPLRIYIENNEIFLSDGHRRLKAINMAINEGHKIESVSVIVEPKLYNEIERIVDLARCNDGKQLEDLELAEVVSRLKNFGWSVSEISKRTGINQFKINNLLALNIAVLEIKKAIQEKKISTTTASKIAKKSKTAEEITKIKNEISDVFMLIKINELIKKAENVKQEIEKVQNKQIKSAATRARVMLQAIVKDSKELRKELLNSVKK